MLRRHDRARPAIGPWGADSRAAAGTSFFTGDLRYGEGEDFIRSVLIVVTLAGLYYKMWQPAVKKVGASIGG